jgi:hypothetical protein
MRSMQHIGRNILRLIVLFYGFDRHAKLLASPCAEINLLAAFTAKRPPTVAGREDAVALAGWAFDNGHLLIHSLNLEL